LILQAAKAASFVPGLLFVFLIAAAATAGGSFIPVIGGPVLAIVLGAIIRSFVLPNAAYRPGIGYASKKVLQGAIIVSGFGISLLTVVKTGLSTLPVTLLTIAVALLLAPFIGRLLQIDAALQVLIGVGTAICGASAIAAVSTVIDPDDADISLAIATIFLYNVVAVLLFPPLGHLMHLTQDAFGVWAGTAINDTSSVVAAGYAYGTTAGAQATIVKLTRATFILPIVAAIAIVRVRRHRAAGVRIPWVKIVPWFILWFLAAAVINTTGAIPLAWHPAIARLATFLIAMALGAIGLQTEIPKLVRAGVQPLALGFALWVAVAVSSLVVQRVSGL
jgi:uncharacterized integral membrane protein (TIGR00698 family)